MNELVSFYRDEALQKASPHSWLAQLQEKALADFTRVGFPTPQQEAWKYTRTDAFQKQPFSHHSQMVIGEPPTLAVGLPITIHNGIVDTKAIQNQLPPGVIVLSLAEALVAHPDKVRAYLNCILKTEHGFQLLNTAMLDQGVFIFVPSGVKIETPIVLSHWQDKPASGVALRHLLIAEPGSQLCVIEDYQGDENIPYFTNTITEIYLGPQAQCTHYKIQRESKQAFHVGHLAVQQSANSHLFSHSFSLGGQWVRSDIQIDLQEKKAQCLMNGIYLTDDKQHLDHHTLVNHLVADCQSDQNYKGILKGQSRAVFNGRVIVAKEAIHTKAQQQNKNLLLHAGAEVDTKPQLEIFADDVICTHGATVGQLDPEALFYLATRGIDSVEASRYLVFAFITENLTLVADNNLKTCFQQLLTEKLEQELP